MGDRGHGPTKNVVAMPAMGVIFNTVLHYSARRPPWIEECNRTHPESWQGSACDISAQQRSRPMKAAVGVGQGHVTVL